MNNGWTPLHNAAANGHLDIVKYLVSEGAFDNYRDKRVGRTALHCASYLGYLEVVKYLIYKDFNIHDSDMLSMTSLEILNDKERVEIEGYIANRLFKIIFLLSKKLHGALPLKKIMAYHIGESNLKFLKEYSGKYIFDENGYEGYKGYKGYKDYNTENILYILVLISTQEKYMNKRGIPDNFIKIIKDYITKKN